MQRPFGMYTPTERCLGRGTTATVWEAVHVHTGDPVALKCYHADGRVDLDRLEREVAALQLLDLPGVVRLLDRGTDDAGVPWVATELVEGAPFPGTREGWPAVEPALRSLLSVLARVHAVGIVHRDLKPSNVLVRPDRSVAVLDFGLACGAILGATFTQAGDVVGTPLYLAPEQLLGERADGRADLYAVGVMLFEALVGEPPHPDRDFVGLWRSRLTRDAPSLATRRAHLPPELCTLVDRLLDRNPANRPRTASEALALLGESQHDGFPWLGGEALVEAVVSRAREGTPCVVGGLPGSGRSRSLSRAVARLRAEGATVWELAAGSGPYRSVSAHVSAQAARSADDAEALVRTALRSFVDAGGVIAVDDPSQIDVWTRRALVACKGAVLATGDRGDVVTQPLSQEDLRALFWGPEQVWRLPSDGALELHRRTGGSPARVVAEVQGWIREGLVRWGPGPPDPLGLEDPPEGTRLHVDRMALDRLSAGLMPVHVSLTPRGRVEPELEEHLEWTGFAGPDATPGAIAALVGRASWQVELEREELVRREFVEEGPLGVRVRVAAPGFALWGSGERSAAHARVADALPPGARNRLEHLARAQSWDASLAEAALLARRWAVRGSNGLAVATVVRAVRALPDDAPGAGLTPLVALAARLAISLRDRATLSAVRTLVPRTGEPGLDAMLRGALAVLEGDGAKARALLDGLGFEDLETELCRHAQRVAAARHQGLSEEEALLEELDLTVGGHPAPDARAKFLTWKGLLRYRQHRFDEAAALHEQALALREDEVGRLSSMLNQVAALLHCHRLDAAEALATRALERAAAFRHPGYEARARFLLRSSANHRGATTPDVELLRALPSDPDLALVEAMVALRGRHPDAESLLRHVERIGSGTTRAYARALRGEVPNEPLPGVMQADVDLVRRRGAGPWELPEGHYLCVLLTEDRPQTAGGTPNVPPTESR